MLGVSLIVLLMAKDFNCAHGYLFEFRKSGQLQFCVSDEAVAFSKRDLDNIEDFTKVDVKSLNGADIPLAKYDCNLVLERGCEFWNTAQFNKDDWSDRFPLVTDFRWNDFPVVLVQKRFEPKFTIPKGLNFTKHFSILAHGSARFLFTDDPIFAKGVNVVIDGIGHTSALRYCTKIPPEFSKNRYPTCGRPYAVTTNNKVLSQGEKWAHAILQISKHDSNRKDVLIITDKIFAHLVPNSQMKENSDYYVSFRTSATGLFKVHTYNVLHSSTNQSSMELLLSEDSSDFLCIDVIFLMTKSFRIETTVLSLEIVDEMRRIQFKKVINKKDRTNEWFTARISSRDHTLKRGWRVKLTAHIIEIVIGAVKFCKEGFTVIRPRQAMTHCSSLVNKNIDPTEEKIKLTQLLSELPGCGMFGNNCAGVRACGQSGSCSCLAGFHGDSCTKVKEENLLRLVLTSVITILGILTALATLAVWIYLRKLQNSRPVINLPSIKFFKNSDNQRTDYQTLLEDHAFVLGDRPKDSKSTEVERYLLSAFAGVNFLKDQFEKFPLGQTQSWDCGFKPENKSKNRYAYLAAYDWSRVKLVLLPGDKNSDYINANYVDGYERPKAYIAGQGPTEDTLDDFWRMVWQEKVSLIVMVTNLVERGKKKCEKYWPDVNQEKRHGLISVRTINEEITADFITRALLVSRYDTNRLVQQLHYTSWPENEVPPYPQSMAMFVEKMFEHKDKNHPILVHSSAGVKRTGTVILIDACLRMVRSFGRIDVVNIFARMRSQRANLIDNLTQYEFAHLVLLEIIANPTFEISCEKFCEEYKKLKANNRKNLNENFSKLKEICERDFQRVETPVKNETAKCRNADFISSSNAIVRLFPYENVVTTSFINAVTVDGYQKAKQFIATQVPMKNTVEDLWRMIDQNNVKQIVVLNEPLISDSEGEFLPSKERRFTFGKLKIILDDFTEEKKFKTLNVQLNTRGISKKVSVKMAYDWRPGKVTPPNTELLIELWDSLKITNDKDVITVVCHDGVTACGLFLGIGFVIEKIKLENEVDVGLAVRTLRKSRPAFLSSEVQFGFLYEAAKNYLCSFDTYRNFK
ncbi:receptor-type tyrosine-protein phosphatase epsilon-like isoform X2 [Cloeon dipterum]|uniref:receptor-type tyrosine-protein phosphatase epsilon-like isoform X2 n=1 Tax=Cloeon dipterum TaxID=197152 RepID=UPI00321F939F